MGVGGRKEVQKWLSLKSASPLVCVSAFLMIMFVVPRNIFQVSSSQDQLLIKVTGEHFQEILTPGFPFTISWWTFGIRIAYFAKGSPSHLHVQLPMEIITASCSVGQRNKQLQHSRFCSSGPPFLEKQTFAVCSCSKTFFLTLGLVPVPESTNGDQLCVRIMVKYDNLCWLVRQESTKQ